MLRSIGKQTGESVKSVGKKKREGYGGKKATVAQCWFPGLAISNANI